MFKVIYLNYMLRNVSLLLMFGKPFPYVAKLLARQLAALLAVAFFGAFGLGVGTARCEPLVLVTLDSPPLEYVQDGVPVGMNVEIVNEAMRRLGREVRIEFVPWRRALQMMRAGSAHGIIDAGYNAERARYLHYPTENIYLEEIYVFKRRDRNIMLDEDLGNAGEFSVGTSRGHFYGERMDKALREGAFKDIHVVTDVAANARMLVAGRLDFFLGVRLPVMHELRRLNVDSEVDIVSMTETGEAYLLDFSPTYLAFSKAAVDVDFVDEVSLVIREMKVDGTYRRIQAKYFNP